MGANGKAAILRESTFGNVEACDNLDARGEGPLHILGGRGLVVEDAIDAVAHHESVGERFNMNVAGTAVQGFTQNGVDDPHDGRVVIHFHELLDLGLILPLSDLDVFAGGIDVSNDILEMGT